MVKINEVRKRLRAHKCQQCSILRGGLTGGYCRSPSSCPYDAVNDELDEIFDMEKTLGIKPSAFLSPSAAWNQSEREILNFLIYLATWIDSNPECSKMRMGIAKEKFNAYFGKLERLESEK